MHDLIDTFGTKTMDIPVLISNFGKTFRAHPSINPKRHRPLMDRARKKLGVEFFIFPIGSVFG